MSFPIFRDAREWSVVPHPTTAEAILATNRRTAQTFSGSMTAFNDFMADSMEAVGTLVSTSVPVGVAPSGAVAPNGAITLGTALPATYAGIWLALPAAAAYTDSAAGIYWCVMSSTTVGVVYDVVLDGIPYVPSNPTAIVDDRASTNFTGITAATTLVTVPVEGGTIGKNGSIKPSFVGSHNSTAGAKTYVIKGDTATWLSAAATTSTGAIYAPTITNRGTESANLSSGVGGNGIGATTVLNTSVDTSVDFNVTFNATVAVATDYAIYESISVALAPKY